MNCTSGIFLFTPDEDPYANMALDYWLFESIGTGRFAASAILRLYSWRIPAITLGYNQNPDRVVNWSLLPPEFPVIRRVTGGRAIYHEDTEITFSLIGSLHLFPEQGRSLKAANIAISQSIVAVLEKIGLKATWSQQSDINFNKSGVHSFKSCFSSLSRYEIVAEGLKIAGGAQRRRGNWFIYQSSIKINGALECEAIGQTQSLSPFPEIIGIADFAPIFPQVFSKNLNIEFGLFNFDESEIAQWNAVVTDLKKTPLKKR